MDEFSTFNHSQHLSLPSVPLFMTASMDKSFKNDGSLEEQIEKVDREGHLYVEAGESHHKDRKERRLVLKQDFSIVLLLSGCYWFAYLVCC